MCDEREIAALRARAVSARDVAQQLSDQEAASGLGRYAEELESRAAALEAPLPPAAAIPSGEPSIVGAGANFKPQTLPEPALEQKAKEP